MSLAGNEFLPADSQSPLGPPRTSPTLSTHSSYNLPPPSAGPRRLSDVQTPAFQPLSAEVVVSTWLHSLTRSVLLHLTTNILPSIKYLTKHGAEQLASDLGYLSNVARALDVEVEQIEKWRNAIDVVEGVSAANAGEQQDQAESERERQLEAENNELVEVFKRMRVRPSVA